MPEISPILAGIGAMLVVLGFALGWFARIKQVRREKAAIHSSWHDQISAQKQEHDRLADQNKSLMDQISQYRGTKKDLDARAVELAESLREARGLLDERDNELRSLRSNLDVAVRQRDQLKADVDAGTARGQALKEKDQKIFRLSRELESWQNRLPPLLERYRSRDLEAQQLEVELERANSKLAALESPAAQSASTRIEPVDDAALAGALDASNEQFEEETSQSAVYPEAEAAADGRPSASETEAENTGIETYLRKRSVDFDLGTGACDPEPDAAAAAEDDSLVDVFRDPGSSGEVDELLEAGDTPAVDAALLNDDAPSAAAGRPANGNGRDDLQRIKGVGPAIEKTLNDLGYYSYDQIAHMSEGDIDRVAQELRGFRSRIYREDWIGQARMLQQEKA